MMIPYPTGTLYYPQLRIGQMGRSRSRSRSMSRSASRSPNYPRKKSPSRYEMDNECKIYIGGLRRDSDEKELERVFSRYGQVQDVWVARSPPGFGFVELDDADDAADAIRDLDGTMICGVKVRVSHSCSRKNLPSVKGMRKPFDVRCYECGEFGHYAYECRERAMRLRRARSSSRSRSRSRSPKRRGRHRSHSRSGSRDRKHRSRSKSPPRKSKKSKKEKKSPSRSPSPLSDYEGGGARLKKNYRKKHDSDSESDSPRRRREKKMSTSSRY